VHPSCRFFGTGKVDAGFIVKFRTMVPNAEELKQNTPMNELQWPDFKITNDPRITPVESSKTSSDEIPQLFNV
jgi:lipopolysaccharide/colanic/teichoic acid biosynthesis glycosyltransferase